MSNSFTDVMEDIAATLGSGRAADYAMATWGKALDVKLLFKHRTEAGLSELPLIMITRPRTDPGRWTIGERNTKQTLKLYYGFHQPDRSLAQIESIRFEEAIEEDLLSYKEEAALPDYVEDIEPKEAVNDEGYFHPVYFGVKLVEVDFIKTI